HDSNRESLCLVSRNLTQWEIRTNWSCGREALGRCYWPGNQAIRGPLRRRLLCGLCIQRKGGADWQLGQNRTAMGSSDGERNSAVGGAHARGHVGGIFVRWEAGVNGELRQNCAALGSLRQ